MSDFNQYLYTQANPLPQNNSSKYAIAGDVVGQLVGSRVVKIQGIPVTAQRGLIGQTLVLDSYGSLIWGNAGSGSGSLTAAVNSGLEITNNIISVNYSQLATAGNFLTVTNANTIFLPLAGGTVTGGITINGASNLNNLNIAGNINIPGFSGSGTRHLAVNANGQVVIDTANVSTQTLSFSSSSNLTLSISNGNTVDLTEAVQDVVATMFPDFTYDDPNNLLSLKPVPLNKIFSNGAGSNNVLTFNGTNVVWAAAPSNSFTIIGGDNTARTVNSGGTLTFEGGTGITTVTSLPSRVTFNIDGTVVTNADSINKLVDVNVVNPQNGDVLVRNGTEFINVPQSTLQASVSNSVVRAALSSIAPITYNNTTGIISLTSGTNGQVLTTVSGTAVWANPTSGGNPITVQDEGSSLTASLAQINFTGTGVTSAVTGNNVTVNIPGSTATAIITKDEGGILSSNTSEYNFVGAGVTATATGSQITVNIPGSTASPIAIQDEGSALTTSAQQINFVGAGVTTTNTGNNVTVTIPGGATGSARPGVSNIDTNITGNVTLTAPSNGYQFNKYNPATNLTSSRDLVLPSTGIVAGDTHRFVFADMDTVKFNGFFFLIKVGSTLLEQIDTNSTVEWTYMSGGWQKSL